MSVLRIGAWLRAVVGNRYWRLREGRPFAGLMRLICETRGVCVDCGIAAEKGGLA